MEAVVQKKEFISIGAVTKAHGIKGEIGVKPLTDEPEQFTLIKSVYLNINNSRTLVEVEKVRLQQNFIILKLAHINDRTAAEQLKGALIEREISELRELEDNEYYVFDLIGLEVKDLDGNLIGELVDVMILPANDVYVIRGGEKEFLVPAIQDIVKKIDLDRNEMLIYPMNGLFE
ncbi:16S rRNA processing protein RimM [candidate division KSB1 bacterium]|nr:16S rRNA processing protein RimM [candidate division KSB1 bacterium]